MSRRTNISAQTRIALASFLAQPQEWRYGYDITLETGLQSGTLYPLLMRLHDRGFLEAEWRPSAKPGRPARHAYRLTASGMKLAREMRPATAQMPGMRLETAT
jgi:DNA-binding PadR family transcriptional regulator